jgi:hypothetical protein
VGARRKRNFTGYLALFMLREKLKAEEAAGGVDEVTGFFYLANQFGADDPVDMPFDFLVEDDSGNGDDNDDPDEELFNDGLVMTFRRINDSEYAAIPSVPSVPSIERDPPEQTPPPTPPLSDNARSQLRRRQPSTPPSPTIRRSKRQRVANQMYNDYV